MENTNLKKGVVQYRATVSSTSRISNDQRPESRKSSSHNPKEAARKESSLGESSILDPDSGIGERIKKLPLGKILKLDILTQGCLVEVFIKNPAISDSHRKRMYANPSHNSCCLFY